MVHPRITQARAKGSQLLFELVGIQFYRQHPHMVYCTGNTPDTALGTSSRLLTITDGLPSSPSIRASCHPLPALSTQHACMPTARAPVTSNGFPLINHMLAISSLLLGSFPTDLARSGDLLTELDTIVCVPFEKTTGKRSLRLEIASRAGATSGKMESESETEDSANACRNERSVTLLKSSYCSVVARHVYSNWYLRHVVAIVWAFSCPKCEASFLAIDSVERSVPSIKSTVAMQTSGSLAV
ncbi:haloacid dehalogenase, partial [Aureobasidium melanogenum]